MQSGAAIVIPPKRNCKLPCSCNAEFNTERGRIGGLEFLARICAVLRRASFAPVGGKETVEVLTRSGWRLDLRSRALVDPEGVAVDLSGVGCDWLPAFLAPPGRGQILELSRARLGAPSDRSVDVLASRLGGKPKLPDGTASVIKTIRGAGYMFACKVLQA